MFARHNIFLHTESIFKSVEPYFLVASMQVAMT